MLKRILIATVSLFFVFNLMSTSFAATKPQAISLEVYNHSNYIIHVEEGFFSRSVKDLYPGASLNWGMSFAINDLVMSYWNGSSYTKIPGCPNGYFGSSVRVRVYNGMYGPKCVY